MIAAIHQDRDLYPWLGRRLEAKVACTEKFLAASSDGDGPFILLRRLKQGRSGRLLVRWFPAGSLQCPSDGPAPPKGCKCRHGNCSMFEYLVASPIFAIGLLAITAPALFFVAR